MKTKRRSAGIGDEAVFARTGRSWAEGFKLLDEDENVLAVQPFRQFLGSSVVSLPTGDTVARIAPGETAPDEHHRRARRRGQQDQAAT